MQRLDNHVHRAVRQLRLSDQAHRCFGCFHPSTLYRRMPRCVIQAAAAKRLMVGGLYCNDIVPNLTNSCIVMAIYELCSASQGESLMQATAVKRHSDSLQASMVLRSSSHIMSNLRVHWVGFNADGYPNMTGCLWPSILDRSILVTSQLATYVMEKRSKIGLPSSASMIEV